MKGIEVLAPAGGREALEAAVYAGADAVYLGGQAFGARASAQNFSREELAEAVAFCRARGVRVHVTVNTLLKDGELESALDFVKFLCAIPVDAVLVQDMGLFSLLRERAPELPLHASTQMSLHTPAGVRLLEGLGARRVVLSRELSLEEIKRIAQETETELECFVHGALCMSVSGQCIFSAMLGSRSGNRGMCAQPCRLPFSASGGTGYDLSLKDLSFLTQVRELSQAGVSSLKIEGRMKRPEYVAAAVSACRQAADGETVPESLLSDLQAVFSRSGFTDGYLTGKTGRAMFGVRRKEDVQGATEKVFSSLRGLYRGERQSVPVWAALSETQEGLCLTVWDKQGHKARAWAKPEGEYAPLSRERCLQQLKKTGATPFLMEEVALPQQELRAGVSCLNALRREALGELLSQREKGKAVSYTEKPLSFSPHAVGIFSLRAVFRSAEQLPAPEKLRGLSHILLPLGTPVSVLARLREEGYPCVLLEIPRALFQGKKRECDGESWAKREMEHCQKAGFEAFSCGNLGAVGLGRELGAQLHGSFSLNVYNTAALDFFEGLGLRDTELSYELTGKEITGLGGRLPRGVTVYGRQALMLVRNCPLKNTPQGCLACRSPGFLTDRKGIRFPVVCPRPGESESAEVLNSVPVWLGGEALPGVDFGILRFTVESAVETGQILESVFRQETPCADYTRGLFYRGVE